MPGPATEPPLDAGSARQRELLAASLADALAGPRKPVLPPSVQSLVDARERNMKGLSTATGLGQAIWARYTMMILDECERCGVEFG